MAHHELYHNDEMEVCLQNCRECQRICLETASFCLQLGSEIASGPVIRLLLDCAEICQTSANFMLRNSDLHGLTCRACAEVCARCATECERISNAQMQACAEVCRRCAQSCLEMAGLATPA
jgi:hypothetical protein